MKQVKLLSSIFFISFLYKIYNEFRCVSTIVSKVASHHFTCRDINNDDTILFIYKLNYKIKFYMSLSELFFYLLEVTRGRQMNV